MELTTSIDVTAPPAAVWDVMSDIERWHEWTPSVRSIRRLDSGPLRIGSRAIVRQPKFPPALWTVTHLEPGKSFTWKSGMPGLRVHATHSVLDTGGGARATLSLRFAGALGPLFGRLTSSINERYIGLEAAG